LKKPEDCSFVAVGRIRIETTFVPALALTISDESAALTLELIDLSVILRIALRMNGAISDHLRKYDLAFLKIVVSR